MYIVVGLGNPGQEYENTRHNAGRMAVEAFAKMFSLGEFETNKKLGSLSVKGEIVGKDLLASKVAAKIQGIENIKGLSKKTEEVMAVLPETFMNKSGKALETLIPTQDGKAGKATLKKAEQLIVVQDDLDMPVGKIKILFNRGSGGHKGIESIVRTIKTEAFARIKVGICPTTPTGKPKKPTGDKLLDFIVGPFKPAELDEMKKTSRAVAEAIATIVLIDRQKAMEVFNR